MFNTDNPDLLYWPRSQIIFPSDYARSIILWKKLQKWFS
jgi:hypothetical protein